MRGHDAKCELLRIPPARRAAPARARLQRPPAVGAMENPGLRIRPRAYVGVCVCILAHPDLHPWACANAVREAGPRLVYQAEIAFESHSITAPLVTYQAPVGRSSRAQIWHTALYIFSMHTLFTLSHPEFEMTRLHSLWYTVTASRSACVCMTWHGAAVT